MASSKPYTCVCCGYKTVQKNDMRKHLYKKKPCPKSVKNVTLTDEIRTFILDNRVYYVPKPLKEPTIAQTIHNYNTINNFVASLDTIEKLTKYIDYKKIAITNVNESIDEQLSHRAQAFLADTKRDGMQIRKEDMYEIIDQVSSLCNGRIQDFNILFDKKYEKLRMYDDGAWKELLILNGCKALLLNLQDSIFDLYECYLVQKFRAAKPYEQARLRSLIEEYYRFIGCFDVPPYVKDRSDQKIMDDDLYDDGSCDIQAGFVEIYDDVTSKMTKSELGTVRKNVLRILVRNTRKNVDELNKKVVALFKMDEAFKELMQEL